MNVLSLCDGMSCGQIALTELDAGDIGYYSSEIYDIAIKVTQDNFPNTIQMGDLVEICSDIDNVLGRLPKIDLVLFGFPCRSLSNATAGRDEYNNGLKGVSGLFYNCNDILRWIKLNNNPDVEFLAENVDGDGKQGDIDEISRELGVEPIMINSSIFSAQERKRLYWTNIEIDILSVF